MVSSRARLSMREGKAEAHFGWHHGMEIGEKAIIFQQLPSTNLHIVTTLMEKRSLEIGQVYFRA